MTMTKITPTQAAVRAKIKAQHEELKRSLEIDALISAAIEEDRAQRPITVVMMASQFPILEEDEIGGLLEDLASNYHLNMEVQS